jgi:hypothetical protein
VNLRRSKEVDDDYKDYILEISNSEYILGTLKDSLINHFASFQIIGLSPTKKLVAMKRTSVATRELISFLQGEGIEQCRIFGFAMKKPFSHFEGFIPQAMANIPNSGVHLTEKW